MFKKTKTYICRVGNETYLAFIVLYSFIIVFCCVENICILTACLCNKVTKLRFCLQLTVVFQMMNTPRNFLIVNMAISDMFLCVFTMPLTLLDIIHLWWPIGSAQVIRNYKRLLRDLLKPLQRLFRDTFETCQKLGRDLLEPCQRLVRDLLETCLRLV